MLEILIVLAIIGLLAAVVAPRVVGYLGRAKSQTTTLQMEAIRGAMQLFYIDMGRYPTEQEGLGALISAPSDSVGWHGPYLDQGAALRDPWDRPYIYSASGNGQSAPNIKSLGRDGAVGGTGEDADLQVP